MEDDHLLDITDEADLFALHHVFQPVINHSLDEFQEGYIHHKLRTEHNQSPLQLWTRGVCAGYPIDDVDEVFLYINYTISLCKKSQPEKNILKSSMLTFQC